MIGIIGTMDEEIISLKRKMSVTQQKEIAGMQFFIGMVGEKEVVAVSCGIGKVNAAVCTQILIDIFNVEYIINTGIAGGLNPDLNIGDIIVASDVVEHKMDTLVDEYSEEEVSNMRKVYFEADQRLLDIAKVVAENLKGDHKVFEGHIASNDEFICSIRIKEDIYTIFTAYCAEMEGTAIAHTCFLNQVPFISIRSVSDKVDPSIEVNFEDFVDVVARNASRMIEGILKMM